MSAAALSGQAFEFYCAICGEKTAVTLGKRAALRRSHIQSGKFACADCRAHINEVRAKVSESGLDASAWAHENAALVGDTSHHMEVFYGRAAGDRFECPLCLSRGSYTIGFLKPVGLDMHLDRCGVRAWMVREEYEMDERRRVQAAAVQERGAVYSAPKVRFVYLIDNPSARSLKIGLSDSPAARLKALATGHSQPLVLVGAIRAVHAESLERRLHREFQPFRIRGEWFADRAIIRRTFTEHPDYEAAA